MQMILPPSLCVVLQGGRSTDLRAFITTRVTRLMRQISGRSATQKPTCDTGVLGAQKRTSLKSSTKDCKALCGSWLCTQGPPALCTHRWICATHRWPSLPPSMLVNGNTLGWWVHARSIVTPLSGPNLWREVSCQLSGLLLNALPCGPHLILPLSGSQPQA